MRKRGLWTSPPGYLGVTAGSWRDGEALEELVSDAYAYVFLRRLGGLADQLRVRPSIRGLVVRNVRNFLTDRQRKADPLGYRIFVRLRAAVERLLERRVLEQRVLARCGRNGRPGEPPKPTAIGNATLLTFAGGRPAPLVALSAFESSVACWNDRLMPELVTAEGRAVPGLVERLAEAVATMPCDGVRAFRFGELAKALKDDARGRWCALWRQQQVMAPVDGAPGAPRVPAIGPDEMLDWPGFRAAVLGCVERSIEAISQSKRQRELWRLWLFVRSTRLDTDDARELPSYSELGRELELPRERVSQLLDHLKLLVCRCLDCQGVDPACATSRIDVPADPSTVGRAQPDRRRGGT